MEEQKSKRGPKAKKNISEFERYMVPGAIVAGSLVVAGAILISAGAGSSFLKGSPSPTEGGLPGGNNLPSEQGQVAVDIANVDLQKEPFIGEKNAPVTLVYWGDYQCPFCKRFDTQTLPSLVQSYVNTGKLRVVFKDLQFLGEDSIDAGLVGNAVWETYPALFFDWHQAMFEAQDEEHGGFGNLQSILQMIRSELAQIDADRIEQAVARNRDKYLQEMEADRQEGASFGVTGTPGFVIGKQRVSGAQPADVFVQLIEQELKK